MEESERARKIAEIRRNPEPREERREQPYSVSGKALQSACNAANTLRVRELLQGRTVSAYDVTTCLRNAWPKVEVMRLLLEHGAEPSMCATTRCMKHSSSIIRLLVEFGYDIKINGHCILQ